MSEEQGNQWAKDRAKEACKRLGALAKKEGVTHEAISEKTGYQRSNITRFFAGTYTPRLDIVMAVIAAINELAGSTYGLGDIDPLNEE